MVLIDDATGGPAEVFAAALRDRGAGADGRGRHGRDGVRSASRPDPQRRIPLHDRGAVRFAFRQSFWAARACLRTSGSSSSRATKTGKDPILERGLEVARRETPARRAALAASLAGVCRRFFSRHPFLPRALDRSRRPALPRAGIEEPSTETPPTVPHPDAACEAADGPFRVPGARSPPRTAGRRASPSSSTTSATTMRAVRRLARLAQPVAGAVLPGLPGSAPAARTLAQAGKEVILHLPMEPDGYPQVRPGPGVIVREQSESEIAEIFSRDLASVPGAVGVNNHMGSAATADPRVMRAVLRARRRPRPLLPRQPHHGRDGRRRARARARRVQRFPRVFLDRVATEPAVREAARRAAAPRAAGRRGGGRRSPLSGDAGGAGRRAAEAGRAGG